MNTTNHVVTESRSNDGWIFIATCSCGIRRESYTDGNTARVMVENAHRQS